MNTFCERVRFERYRLAVISSWPEGDAKRAALASARIALEREMAILRSLHGDKHTVRLVTA